MLGKVHITAIRHEDDDKVVIEYYAYRYRASKTDPEKSVAYYDRNKAPESFSIGEEEYARARKFLGVRSLFGKDVILDGGFVCPKGNCPGWIIVGRRQAPIGTHFFCPYGRKQCLYINPCVAR